MKNGTEIAYTYAPSIKVAKQLSAEIDAAIAEAVKAEREACAFKCEEQSRKYKNAQQEIAALQCAAAIRARSVK